MESIQLHDKEFDIYIHADKINAAIERLATRLNSDLKESNPLFIGVLNGSFMFASDLLKKLTIPCEISFVKVASYHGTASTGSIKELFGLNENLEGRTVVILEDIVDTGQTIEKIYSNLKEKGAVKIKIATLLYKPETYKKLLPLDYVAIEIPNDFVVGYGLDYNGLGRNLMHIYKIKELK
jgi:hypoxanthine phosphoribosyltransferase